MKKVITYGTFDLLHYGHMKLLERAKALGDYLIVGVTSDNFEKSRGKINVQQSLIERIEGVERTGLADKIIVEEYRGQKIADIQKYHVDIFAIGSDWKGQYDYLNEYCEVIYLDRTEGISSSQLRSKERRLRLGLIGETRILDKYYNESHYVNGLEVVGICSDHKSVRDKYQQIYTTDCYEELLERVDAVYIISHPTKHYQHIKKALLSDKHVLCESPITLHREQTEELFQIASERHLVLMDAIKTAYGTAYNRLLLLVKSGIIGRVVSIDNACTSLEDTKNLTEEQLSQRWSSMTAWGPTALLPVFQILGTEYQSSFVTSMLRSEAQHFDVYSKIDIFYENACATCQVGNGVKSEGHMIISGTKGYIYVPAPWWKMNYFEIRYEDQNNNERRFYQLDGEGIRYELVCFVKAITNHMDYFYVNKKESVMISEIIQNFCECHNMSVIQYSGE